MSENQSEIIDIRGLLRTYRSKWYVFAVSVLLCGIIGYLFTLRILPKYEVKASIQLNDSQTFGSMISGGLSGVSDLLGGNANGEDEVQVIASHSQLTEVARRLGLDRMRYRRLRPTVYQMMYKDYPIDIVPGSDIKVDTLSSQILCMVKVDDSGKAEVTMQAKGNELFSGSNLDLPAEMKTSYGTFSLVATDHFVAGESFKNRITINSYSQAAENLREYVNIGLAAKNSQIVEFQMFSDNTDYAIDVINTIIAAYINRTEETRLRENSAMAQFLQDRLDLITASLDKTETQIAQLQENRGIGSIAEFTTGIYERLAAAESAMTSAQVNYEMAALTLQMVRESAKDNSLIPLQGDSEEITRAITSYNNLVLRRQSVEQSAKADNSAIQRLDEQILALRANLIASLESLVRHTLEFKNEHEKIFKELMAQIDKLPKAEYDFRSIIRQRTIQEEIYVFLLQKQEETAMLLNNMDSRATIIDPAYALNEDQATSPMVIMIIAIFFGLMIPPVWFYFFKPKAKKAKQD